MKWMLTGKRHLRKQISLTTHFSVVIWYLQLSALLQSMQKRTPHISLLLLHLRWRHQKVPTHTKEICGMVNTKSDLLSHFVTNMVDLIYSRSNSSMFSTPIFCYSFPLCCRLSVVRSSETTCTEVPKTMHVLNHKTKVSENFWASCLFFSLIPRTESSRLFLCLIPANQVPVKASTTS